MNENIKIIESISKTPLYNDEPKHFSYSCYFKDKYSKKHLDNSVASGVAFSKKRALFKLLGETFERYALTVNNNRNFTYDSYTNLRKTYKHILNPLRVFPFSEAQTKTFKMNKQSLLSTRLHWVKAKSLVTYKNTFIPAQLVFVPYIHQNSEPLIVWPISTGAAAGQTLEDAIYKGICEVVERDSFMISYLNKLPCPKVDINHFQSTSLKKIVNRFARYRIEVFIINMTTDLNIPSIAAILIDRTRQGPAVTVGLKAGYDIYDVIIGALEEATMLLGWQRDKFIYLSPNYKRDKIIHSIEDRAHFWFSVNMIRYLNFWLKSSLTKTINPKTQSSLSENLEKALNTLRDRNIDAFYFDLTDAKLRQSEYKIVKVIIPDLQPLYLDEEYPYFGKDRLYQTPVNMKIFQKPKTESQLNTVPHPFL